VQDYLAPATLVINNSPMTCNHEPGNAVVRLVMSVALAAATGQAAPADCVQGTLADYFALPIEGCSLAGPVVSDFLNPGVLPGSSEIDPTTVMVTPLFGGVDGPGLLFSYGATASVGQVLESVAEFVLTFSAEAQGRASLRSQGTSVSDGGAVVVTSEFCLGSLFAGVCDGVVVPLGVFDVGLDAQTFDQRELAAAAVYSVRHDAVIDGTFGPAALESVELRFSQIPEPSTAATCLMSVAGLAVALGRRARYRSALKHWRT
jgi:hypothetical protein